MTVELRHLRAFLMIADEASITRAAIRMHVTQPALSRTLRQLETHLGVRLVDRSTHHLRLTSAGRTLRDRAAAAVAAVDDVLDPTRAEASPLRLGHAWSALGEHTVTLLRRWGQTNPQIPLELLRVDDRSAGLLRGAVDLAILRGSVDHLPSVHFLTLLSEPRVAAVAADSALAEQSELRLADLVNHPIALNSVSGTTGLDLWPSGHRPALTLDVANTDDWLAAIQAGRAVGISSAATAAQHPIPGVRFLPLTDAPPISVHLVWQMPPSHPAVPELVRFTAELLAET